VKRYEGVDVQYPWEDLPRRYHEHPLHLKSYWIDKYPVTNAAFKIFLDATRYHPGMTLTFYGIGKTEPILKAGKISQ
jgi:iron(II)-dependent oxidoreductase